MLHIATLEDLSTIMSELRASAGMSYRAVAEKSRINPGTLLQMEHAQHWPRLDTVCRTLQWYRESATIGWDPHQGKE